MHDAQQAGDETQLDEDISGDGRPRITVVCYIFLCEETAIANKLE